MKKFYVYIHTCPNGKKYVGCTTQARPEIRWNKGRGYWYNKHFYSAILKHGWNNIKHEVFEVESEEEMYRKEVELISFYHSNDPEYGYNHSVGGERSSLGCKHSEESKRKMSEAIKKRWLDPEVRKHLFEAAKKLHSDPEYRKKIAESKKGKPLSEEHRKHLSEVRKGKPLSEEHKRHIGESRKGKPLSEEFRKHLSEIRKGKPQPKVKIQLPDGTIIEISKQNLARHYINKGKEFEYVS